MTAGESLSPLPAEKRPHFSWLAAPHLNRVIDALEAAEPHCARFVGGCVRDSLLEQTPKDFDVATVLTPDRSSAALKAAGLGVAPTGVEHGTVTAIVDHKGVEVTTLRADVSTDGRRATVAFTRDWSVDASRRDFTFNAIYLTPDGKLYDPVGGVADARARQVRFIGNPEHRIREDLLRIMRFFRFSARFCAQFDEAGLAACAKLKDGMSQLSAERIGAEMSGILSLARAAFALEAMQKTGVLKTIWPGAADITTASLMKDFDSASPASLMLAALYGEEGEGIGAALRLSNAENAVRSRALRAVREVVPGLAERDLRVLIYKIGKDGFADAILLAAARKYISAEEFNRMKAFADSAEVHALSLSGRHIVDAGIMPGPDVSRLLAKLEAVWINEDFPGEARQRILLDRLIKSEPPQ